ncbi:1,4-dihydroxy-2-naphthoate polyprenyltransferase [Agrococcus sp. ARC_14]|uniref:1,4-dihydroxy-2-naphthoate polyprenyltransferase n=1 Tax=Agrococcus sp. ARC_14 TaxID=2919927 RepID=UPI001F05C66C|nr:1,4-dihydroxy-2-naphthoate polyprenyltransferase [Agrococcus sp. ARC_14]MCH1882128.1 1,4-dihydroxy-2-naphthoate polyprenyltransferase [Agrococcus sp. ARC_14]
MASPRSGNPAKRAQLAGTAPSPATPRDWIAAARPRTLGMAIAPVALGTAAAFNAEGYHLGIALACLALAVFLQIGVNFANDYSDGVKGTDAVRVGPGRLVGAGKAAPTTVRNVAIGFLAAGALAGILVVLVSGRWWLLLVGVVCIIAAWTYTGGKRPYGYYALGELMAFLFFGPVAVMGTTYAILGRITEDSVALGIAIGAISAALMLCNNLRDIETDRAAGKRSLATLIGRRASKVLFVVLMLVPLVILGIFAYALAYGIAVFAVLLLAGPAMVIVAMARTPRDLITALGLTGLTALLYGVGLAIAIWGGPAGFVSAV